MPPYSHRVLRRCYSLVAMPIALRLRDCHSLWSLFPERSAHVLGQTLRHISAPFARRDSVRPPLFSFALLAASIFFLLLRVLRYFSSPRAPAYCYALFGDPGFRARLAATPGLSQLATTFFATTAKPSSRWFYL